MKFNGKSAHPHDLETKDVHGEYSRHAAEGEYGVDTKKAESDGEGDNAEEKEDEGKGDDEKKDDVSVIDSFISFPLNVEKTGLRKVRRGKQR